MVVKSHESESLKEMLDRVLDKGVVIDAKVRTYLSGSDLIGVNALVGLSSLKTARKVGFEFPEGTDFDAIGWKDLASCPLCGKEVEKKELQEKGCPWCGWSYRLKTLEGGREKEWRD